MVEEQATRDCRHALEAQFGPLRDVVPQYKPEWVSRSWRSLQQGRARRGMPRLPSGEVLAERKLSSFVKVMAVASVVHGRLLHAAASWIPWRRRRTRTWRKVS